MPIDRQKTWSVFPLELLVVGAIIGGGRATRGYNLTQRVARCKACGREGVDGQLRHN